MSNSNIGVVGPIGVVVVDQLYITVTAIYYRYYTRVLPIITTIWYQFTPTPNFLGRYMIFQREDVYHIIDNHQIDHIHILFNCDFLVKHNWINSVVGVNWYTNKKIQSKKACQDIWYLVNSHNCGMLLFQLLIFEEFWRPFISMTVYLRDHPCTIVFRF